MSENLDRLAAEGVAVRLDGLSRERLTGGQMADQVGEWRVVGITSNPTIFAKAIRSGARYDEQVGDVARRGVRVEEAVRLLTAFDVCWAWDVLRPVNILETAFVTAATVRQTDGRPGGVQSVAGAVADPAEAAARLVERAGDLGDQRHARTEVGRPVR
ncbi:transaldolase family protein [Streptomyces prasinus]|uniref:transaldolase family protein n=1 Tax=Streptomyces prasinus TaxID=67345 RepID=UPI003632BB25